MKRGEKVVLIVSVVFLVGMMGWKYWDNKTHPEWNKEGIPFYSTASKELEEAWAVIAHEQNCKSCHSLWTLRDMTQSVPAPALDGIGSLRDEAWFYQYFSAKNPQEILPSRLKREYRMPSFADLPEQERRTLASYMASLKVKDWYLEETRKAEYEKLTGKDYQL
jgi:mono/diheme cytochrome c family protein